MNQAKQQVIATLNTNIATLKTAINENVGGYIVVIEDGGLGLDITENQALVVSLDKATRYSTKEEAHAAMKPFTGDYKVKLAGFAMLQEINKVNKLIKEINK